MKVSCWVLVALLLGGCATVTHPNPKDPLEAINRPIFDFNMALDRKVVKPVAQAYTNVVPKVVRTGVSNFFGNLGDMWSIVNNALQGKRQETGDSIGRVVVNTFLGFGGLMDIASDFHTYRHPATFGQTLGHWGIGPGPYVVLPLLGPLTTREVAALPLDWNANPVGAIGDTDTRYGAYGLQFIDLRTKYLGADALLDQASLDPYSFTRDAYLQRRRSQDYDGDPPDENPDAGQ